MTGKPLNPSFDALAGGYDTLHFLKLCAEALVARSDLRPGERVLDVATGTGTAALAAARRVGETGTVVGLDLSENMLAVARAKAKAAGLANLSFVQGDAARLPFPDGHFGALLCASALFFMPDMAGTLREWRRVLAADGRLAFSSFGRGLMQPLGRLWAECLGRHGLTPWTPPFGRLKDPETCRALLEQAGLKEVRVEAAQLGYFITPEARWQDILAGLEGEPLKALSPAQQQAIRAEHLAELRALAGPEGLWVSVSLLCSSGRKA